MATRPLHRTTIALLVALVMGPTAAGCTMNRSAGATSTAPTQQSVQDLRARLSGPVAVSPVISEGSGHAVALAVMKQLTSPAIPQVLLFSWDGTAWRRSAAVVLDVGGSVADDNRVPTPITTADLTPAPEPELVVTVHYNAGPATAILSKFGGQWHALTFVGGLARPGDERFDVHVDGNTVSSHENNCLPDCAQGHQVTTKFRFDPATGRLVAVSR